MLSKRILIIFVGLVLSLISMAQSATVHEFSNSRDSLINTHGLGENGDVNKYIFAKQRSLKSNLVLPGKYDLRTVDDGIYLSSVKDQGKYGTCWTFATMGAIESYWLKQGRGKFDLSELHLATCNGFNKPLSDGGNYYMSTAYFASLIGPVEEKDDPYTLELDSTCKGWIRPAGYVKEARFLPGNQPPERELSLLSQTIDGKNLFDRNLVKQAIMENGALYINMYINNSFFNPDDFTYYYCGLKRTNHAILLAGWDDNKEVTGNTIVKPKSRGAWICRNSYGTDWGEQGYFYISYEDTRALSNIAYFPSAVEYDENMTVFQYDELGYVDSIHFESDTVSALVRFNTKSATELTGIGLFVVKENEPLTIEIYNQFDGEKLYGLLESVRKTAGLPGYYTIQLPNFIPIQNNQDFYVKVNYISQDSDGVIIPVENGPNATIETDNYWIKDNNQSSWKPIGINSECKYDLCIKAYGNSNIILSDNNSNSSLTVDNSLYHSNPGCKIYPNPTKDKVYIESLEGLTPEQIILYSIDGRIVRKLETKLNQAIDISSLATGVYFVYIKSGNSTFTTKLVKQ
jgi:C1A family cysteine protease